MLRRHLAPALIVAGIASAAPAQDAARPEPGDSQANPRAREYQHAFAAARAAKPPTEKRAWIGVSVSPATPAVAHQLKLPEGTGLVVEFVEPKSPADEGGIKPYDMLLKLDDQILIDPEQFAVLVRMRKAGEEVKLTLTREGQTQVITVKLIEHEVARLADLEQFQLWTQERPREAAARLPQFPYPLRLSGPNGDVEKSVTWFDGKRQITVNTEDGKSMLLVTDPANGRILMKAPVDTEQERDALPPDIRGVLKYLPLGAGPDRDAKPEPDSNPSAPPKPPQP